MAQKVDSDFFVGVTNLGVTNTTRHHGNADVLQ